MERILQAVGLGTGRASAPTTGAAWRANRRRLTILAALAALAVIAYLLLDANIGNERLFSFALRIRAPKIAAMLIAGFAIGAASIVFQSIIANTIVTPCLLGMNALYTLIHTAVYFVAGSGSIFAVNANAAFAVDLVIMAFAATLIYGFLFKKTNYNGLYFLYLLLRARRQ